MPGLNHKGPNGEGPQTGRGLGQCGSKSSSAEDNTQLFGRRIGRKRFEEDTDQNANTFPGRAQGLGRGKGRGRRRRLND